MAKYLITLPPMPKDKVKAAWTSVIDASVGSNLKMDKAYINESNGQAICCWDAPDQKSVEDLFAKAQVETESIKQVVLYSG